MKIGPVAIVLPALALLLVAGASKSQPKPFALTRGKAYRAVFAMPPGLEPHAAEVAKVMPAGSDLLLDGSKLEVRFIAPHTGNAGDVSTPFGVLKLETLEELG